MELNKIREKFDSISKEAAAISLEGDRVILSINQSSYIKVLVKEVLHLKRLKVDDILRGRVNFLISYLEVSSEEVYTQEALDEYFPQHLLQDCIDVVGSEVLSSKSVLQLKHKRK